VALTKDLLAIIADWRVLRCIPWRVFFFRLSLHQIKIASRSPLMLRSGSVKFLCMYVCMYLIVSSAPYVLTPLAEWTRSPSMVSNYALYAYCNWVWKERLEIVVFQTPVLVILVLVVVRAEVWSFRVVVSSNVQHLTHPVPDRWKLRPPPRTFIGPFTHLQIMSFTRTGERHVVQCRSNATRLIQVPELRNV